MTASRFLLVAAFLCPTGLAAQDLPGVRDPFSAAPTGLPGVRATALCDALGPGYVLIPETETCLKISAGVITDFNVDVISNNGRRSNNSGSRFGAQGRVSATSETQTRFGPLRTHVQMRFNNGIFND